MRLVDVHWKHVKQIVMYVLRECYISIIIDKNHNTNLNISLLNSAREEIVICQSAPIPMTLFVDAKEVRMNFEQIIRFPEHV